MLKRIFPSKEYKLAKAYSKMNLEQLKLKAKEKGISIPANPTREELINALTKEKGE